MKVFQVVFAAMTAAVGGIWVHWVWVRQKTKEADLRERERQAEYDAFKKKRRLVGGGDVERMERAEKLTELMLIHLKHGITAETWDEMKMRILGTTQRRPDTTKPSIIMGDQNTVSYSGTFGPDVSIQHVPASQNVVITNVVGNIGNAAGKREWSGRDEDEIVSMIDELFEMLWLHHYRSFKRNIDTGVVAMNENYKKLIESSKDAIERYETKFKDRQDEVGETAFDRGVLNGKMAALRWAIGKEWDLLDT